MAKIFNSQFFQHSLTHFQLVSTIRVTCSSSARNSLSGTNMVLPKKNCKNSFKIFALTHKSRKKRLRRPSPPPGFFSFSPAVKCKPFRAFFSKRNEPVKHRGGGQKARTLRNSSSIANSRKVYYHPPLLKKKKIFVFCRSLGDRKFGLTRHSVALPVSKKKEEKVTSRAKK